MLDLQLVGEPIEMGEKLTAELPAFHSRSWFLSHQSGELLLMLAGIGEPLNESHRPRILPIGAGFQRQEPA